MSSEWRYVCLRDVTSILGDGLHGTPEYDPTGEYYFINGNNLGSGKIVFNSGTKRVSANEFQKHKKNLTDRTILVSINGTIGNVAFYNNEKVVLGKSACYFNVVESVDKHFVRYVLESQIFQTYIENLATGSTIKNVSLKLMRDFQFRVPPIASQQKISGILAALDARISLLRETNDTLEAIAQTLFKSWFVDFDPVRAKMEGRVPEGMDEATAELFPDEFDETELGMVPKGWSVGTLADMSLLNPESWTTKKHPDVIAYVDLANAKNNEITEVIDYEFDDAPSRARRVLRSGDTIVGTVRPGNRSFAFIFAPPENLTGSTGFAVLRPSAIEHSEFVYLAATQDSSIEHLAHVADGGAYPAVRPDAVSALRCVVPPLSVLAAFHAAAAPLLECVCENHQRAGTISILRDTLLPRLISGQLRLPEAAVEFESIAA